jgi:uncharacterized protein (DUF433 family)
MIDIPIDYIVVDDNERARIKGKGFKVRILVEFIQAGATPEQLTQDYDLTLAEIHAALSYYYDHQAEIDSQIADGKALMEQHRPETDARRHDLIDRARAKGIQLPDEPSQA